MIDHVCIDNVYILWNDGPHFPFDAPNAGVEYPAALVLHALLKHQVEQSDIILMVMSQRPL